MAQAIYQLKITILLFLKNENFRKKIFEKYIDLEFLENFDQFFNFNRMSTH